MDDIFEESGTCEVEVGHTLVVEGTLVADMEYHNKEMVDNSHVKVENM